VIRFREGITIKDAAGKAAAATEWLGSTGRAKMLENVCVTQEETAIRAIDHGGEDAEDPIRLGDEVLVQIDSEHRVRQAHELPAGTRRHRAMDGGARVPGSLVQDSRRDPFSGTWAHPFAHVLVLRFDDGEEGRRDEQRLGPGAEQEVAGAGEQGDGRPHRALQLGQEGGAMMNSDRAFSVPIVEASRTLKPRV
jgi:hypothetical protein